MKEKSQKILFKNILLKNLLYQLTDKLAEIYQNIFLKSSSIRLIFYSYNSNKVCNSKFLGYYF